MEETKPTQKMNGGRLTLNILLAFGIVFLITSVVYTIIHFDADMWSSRLSVGFSTIINILRK